jgi:hypothetical protein
VLVIGLSVSQVVVLRAVNRGCSLAVDLDKGGAVDSPIDNVMEHCLLLLVVVNFFFMSFQPSMNTVISCGFENWPFQSSNSSGLHVVPGK